MTYTVVATDAHGAVGLATCSSSMFLGSKTVHLSAHGEPPLIVVSQAFSSSELGASALAALRAGASAADAVDTALKGDDCRSLRQLLAADANGAAAGTGDACVPAAGDLRTDDGLAALAGNMLESDAVVPEALRAFAAADGPLADRLLAALYAGHAAGGDFRGDRSAALVVLEPGGLGPRLNVDEHRAPVGEIGRLLDLHRCDVAVRRCVSWWFEPGAAPPAGLESQLQHALPQLGETGEVWLALLARESGISTAQVTRSARVARAIRSLIEVREAISGAQRR